MQELSGTGKRVTVFGGSGFVGRHLVRALAKRGYRIRVAVRRPDLAGHLQPLGGVSQITAVQANLRYPDSVRAALDNCDYAVNLVGILQETSRQGFDAVQARGAAVVAELAREMGIKNLIHASAIGADSTSDIGYARSKGVGEEAVLSVFPEAVIMRPSIVFGPEDDFFNRFAAMARFSPVLPLIGGGTTKFQPVFAGDVAEAMARAIDGDLHGGSVYELGGPNIMSFKDCLELILSVTERKRGFVSIPWGLAEFQGRILQMLPNAPLTRDQVLMLKSDNLVSTAAKADGRTLEGFGITPRTVASVVPDYLKRYRERGQFGSELA